MSTQQSTSATPSGEWARLNGLRQGMILRCEKYAGFTLPRLCTPTGHNPQTEDLSHDWQSVGAQAVNHVVNKLVLALYAPSRPFFRLEADAKWKAEVIGQGVPENVIDEALAKAEQEAVKELDRRGTIRPKLYQALSQLVVLGNTLVYLPEKKGEDMRVFGIKHFVVRRTGTGKVKTILVRERLLFDELDPDVQTHCTKHGSRNTATTEVEFYRWLVRESNGTYTMTQWVDAYKLPETYSGKWPEDKLPYRVLTWQLADEADYGTGLVEDYVGAFAALSSLSEAQVTGALLSSEFRWLVNPGGVTKPDDLETSANGSALPGLKDDVSLVSNSKSGDLKVVADIAESYIRRIGQGFLMNSAVTRDAERVTAEEIRRQAQELETSFGGTYSRIAVDFQGPVADWLLTSVDIPIAGTKLRRSIVTGLDALSRSGDLDSLRAALADFAAIGQLNPQLLAALRLDTIGSTIFAGHGLSTTKFTRTAEEMKAMQEAEQQAQQEAVTQENASKAASTNIVQQGQPTQ